MRMLPTDSQISEHSSFCKQIAKSIVAQNHGATVKQQHVAPSRFGANGQQKTKFLAYLLSAQAILVE